MATSVTKFFRKYNKNLLAVFMVLLMVAFLLPSTIRSFGQHDPAKDVIGEAYGKDIYRYNRASIKNQTEILDSLNRAAMTMSPDQRQGPPFNWQAFLRFSGATSENEIYMNYYLMTLEARRMGIEISAEQVDRTLAERKIPPDLVNQIKDLHQISLNDLRGAVANFLAMESAFEMAGSSVTVSEPEMKFLYRQITDTVTAEILPLGARDYLKQVPPPADKDLANYFAQHQNQFQYPDRVEVEYLSADLDQIKGTINISKDRARQYWQENPKEFTTTTMPASQPGKPASTAPTQPVEVPMTFEQAYPKVVDKLQYDKARDLAIRAMLEAKRLADAPWTTVTANPTTGMKDRPAKVADYAQIADQISKQYNVRITYNRSPLVSSQEAKGLTGIGTAFILEHQQPVQFSDYAFRVVPLVQPPTGKERTERLILVPFQNSSGLLRQYAPMGEEKGLYLFRITKVDPKHLPTSLPEVKAKVTQDYQSAQAYKTASENANKLCQAAGAVKLSDLAKDKKSPGGTIVAGLANAKIEPQTFALRSLNYYAARIVPPQIPGVEGDTAKFADTVFDKLWNQPTTQPSGTRTCVVIPDDKNHTAYVVQLLSKKPATEEDFKSFKFFPGRMFVRAKIFEFAKNWFGGKNLHARTRFIPKVGEMEE